VRRGSRSPSGSILRGDTRAYRGEPMSDRWQPSNRPILLGIDRLRTSPVKGT
jgi:hypothetical protein